MWVCEYCGEINKEEIVDCMFCGSGRKINKEEIKNNENEKKLLNEEIIPNKTSDEINELKLYDFLEINIWIIVLFIIIMISFIIVTA